MVVTRPIMADHRKEVEVEVAKQAWIRTTMTATQPAKTARLPGRQNNDQKLPEQRPTGEAPAAWTSTRPPAGSSESTWTQSKSVLSPEGTSDQPISACRTEARQAVANPECQPGCSTAHSRVRRYGRLEAISEPGHEGKGDWLRVFEVPVPFSGAGPTEPASAEKGTGTCATLRSLRSQSPFPPSLFLPNVGSEIVS